MGVPLPCSCFLSTRIVDLSMIGCGLGERTEECEQNMSMEAIGEDEIFSVAKQISQKFAAEWSRLQGERVAWHMSEVQERVFFEVLLHEVNARRMATADVVEMLKVYLRHADWIGLLVCDSSPLNGNGSHGPTWALVRPNGILASFGGGSFQAIYEPLYEKHGRSHFGILCEDEDNPENSYITTLPENFRNPLALEEFANGAVGQDIIAVSRRLLLRDRTENRNDWVEKHRNNKGTTSNYDILTTAALDYHQKLPVIRGTRRRMDLVLT